MRILLGLLFCLYFSISASGQDDCKILFTYTWTVESEANNEIELGLPTTQFLCGYTSDREERSFQFVGLSSNQATLISHLSSDFCMDHGRIIDKVFKGDKSFYFLKLRTRTDKKKEKFEIKEIKVPIDSLDVLFDAKKRQIIIQLPTIKTR